MAEDLTQGLPSDAAPAPEPAAPSISDHASRGIELALERQAKRDAGETVSAEMPPAPARDEHGKFAPKPKPSDKEPAPAATPKPASPEAAPQAQTPDAAAAPAALQPPDRWSQDEKASFNRLPLDAQRLILDRDGRREAAVTQKFQEIADQRRAIEPIVAAYNEHAEFLDQRSREIAQPAARILGDMVHLYRQGTTGQPHERTQALGFVAQLFGIDLRALLSGQGQQQQPQQGQERVPPEIMRELQQLRQQTEGLNRFQQSIVKEREQQSLSATQRQYDDFVNAKGEDGQPKHPFIQAVGGTMASLVEAGHSLEDAYAIATKPIHDAQAARQGAQDAQRQATEAQTRADAAKSAQAEADKVAAARRAGGPRPRGTQPGMAQAQSIADRTSEGMRRAGIV